MRLSILTILGLFLFGIHSNAQMADGSTVPDFTSTDINGNTHALYADYLNQGKPVVIDVSATWCGPCWSYHNTHALKDLYTVYGPAGSDEMGVLFVEGDGSTNQADLEGTGNSTAGDWVTGTPYPILDDAAVSNLLQISYYPTIYGVCPDGKIYEFGQENASSLVNLFANLFKLADIQQASTHSLRRTFATVLNDNATNVFAIQKLMRHKNIATTMLYVNVTDTQLANATNNLKFV